MAEKQSLVEEALIQMKRLEDVVAENAKGILASTMKKEIGELVKESLTETDDDSDITKPETAEVGEQEDIDVTDDETVDVTDDETEELPTDEIPTDELPDLGDADDNLPGGEPDFDDDIVDLTNATDEEILQVFKAMGEDDGIIIKKDGDTIDLDDNNEDVHYKISLGDEGMESGVEEGEVSEQDMTSGDDEIMYEISLDGDEGSDWEELDVEFGDEDDDLTFEPEGEPVRLTPGHGSDMDLDDEDASFEKTEAKEGFKPKGVGMGKPKFDYKKEKGGFKDDMKQGTRGVGIGKPKFEFKEGDKAEEMPDKEKEGGETAEASRTLGNGRRFGRHGLPKPKAAPRHINIEAVEKEMQMLREKNEEYRKALNIFRSKLNEVAIFNSNLAYATRLFTEHSTTKHEKINILRRFDSVETLKESKALYKTIKDELSSHDGGKLVKESIQDKIEKTPASGSAANLIESKTYENPQFLRMKDLMAKIAIK